MTIRRTVRVLVVEDSPTDQYLIRRALERCQEIDFDIEVLTSTKGLSRLLDTIEVDLMLLDYDLPGQSGLEFLRGLPVGQELPPIIMLTGSGDELVAKEAILAGAYDYFLKARTPKGKLIDSVARFHLGNGARLERINWLGDLSPKGVRESAGVMVNYLYRLDDIEKNHEAYANDGDVVASSAVKKLLKGEGRRLLDMRLGS